MSRTRQRLATDSVFVNTSFSVCSDGFMISRVTVRVLPPPAKFSATLPHCPAWRRWFSRLSVPAVVPERDLRFVSVLPPRLGSTHHPGCKAASRRSVNHGTQNPGGPACFTAFGTGRLYESRRRLPTTPPMRYSFIHSTPQFRNSFTLLLSGSELLHRVIDRTPFLGCRSCCHWISGRHPDIRGSYCPSD